MQPIISIITPVYNSFSLLSRSIDSFTKWNNNKIEWVIVDDCSSDDTYQLLLSFKEKNPNLNISICTCEINSGPGVARNIGIRNAKGNYIAFLDSDDFFEDSFWNTVYKEIKNNRDCIIFDTWIYYSDENKIEWPLFRNGQPEGKVSIGDAIVHVLGAPWGKVYKRDILMKNNVAFLPQKSNEDIPFTKHAVSCSSDIIYIKKKLYNYVQREGSLIHDESSINIQNTINSFDYILQNVGSRYPLEVEALFVSNYLYSFALQLYNTLPKNQYLQIIRNTEKLFPNYYSNPYLKKSTLQQKIVVACVRYKIYIGIKIILWIRKIRDKRLYGA